jgi:hypothetical protein
MIAKGKCPSRCRRSRVVGTLTMRLVGGDPGRAGAPYTERLFVTIVLGITIWRPEILKGRSPYE